MCIELKFKIALKHKREKRRFLNKKSNLCYIKFVLHNYNIYISKFAKIWEGI